MKFKVEMTILSTKRSNATFTSLILFHVQIQILAIESHLIPCVSVIVS